MTEKIPDLWPEDFGTTEITSPLVFLKRQAKALAEKTKGLLEGIVQSPTIMPVAADEAKFRYTFLIKAPALGYTYRLFEIVHTIRLYPVDIYFLPKNTVSTAKDEDELKAVLTKILSDPETIRIVNALIAQTRQ